MGNSVPDVVTAVQDRLSLTVREVKTLLRMDLDDDEDNQLIELAISAAKQEADSYMNNPFWEVADLNFDDMANWPGNRTHSSLESPGSSTASDQDIIYNNETYDESRNNNSVPDMWTYPRVELDIPDAVKLGVVKYVQLIVNGPTEGVGSEKIGDWQVTFNSSHTDRATFIKETFWGQFALRVGF